MSIKRRSSSLLVELLYLGNHDLDLLIEFQEVGIVDALTRLDGREVVKLWQWILGIGLLLLRNLRLAKRQGVTVATFIYDGRHIHL